MKDKDTRSLAAIDEWQSREYKNEHQKMATLQVIINGALEEQNRLTRTACADAVLQIVGRRNANYFLSEVRDACERIEAT